MGGIDGGGAIGETWHWLRPVAAIAGAIAAGAGTGVGAVYFNQPPSAPGIVSADPALVRRLSDLESWREAHDRDITKRWEDAGEKIAGNRAEITELRQRMDRLVDRDRGRGNGSGGGKIVEEVHP